MKKYKKLHSKSEQRKIVLQFRNIIWWSNFCQYSNTDLLSYVLMFFNDDFWFYSMLVDGWPENVCFLDFLHSSLLFDTPETPGSASAVVGKIRKHNWDLSSSSIPLLISTGFLKYPLELKKNFSYKLTEIFFQWSLKIFFS